MNEYGRFLGSKETSEDAQIVIMGAPMDWTASFRPGSRFGPERIRSVSESLEEYSLHLRRDLQDVPFYDAGDLILPFGDVRESLKIINDAAVRLYKGGKTPCFLGGEHLVTLPLVEAASSVYPDLFVFHFDAHMDLRSGYLGQRYSHASVMRYVSEAIGEKRLFQFGIRSGIEEEVEYGKDKIQSYSVDFFSDLKRLIDYASSSPIYISLDIDVVDPAFAPGTGTPEPGGISSREIIEVIHAFHEISTNIVGFDLVEVAPPYDHSDITSILAAKVLREAIFICSDKKSG